jgi:lambda family phage minor tail protein L
MPIPQGSIFTGFDLFLVNTNWANSPPTGIPDYSFTNDCNENLGSVVWTRTYKPMYGSSVTRTYTYSPFPIEATGFEFSQDQLPRPKLRVANVNQMLGGILRANDDLVGAKVARWRTFAKYLDDANFITRQPGTAADPTAYFPPDIFYIERKVIEDKNVVEFELVSAMDLSGIKLPKRQVMTTCPFKYRGGDCNYTGSAHPIPGLFNVDGSPVTDGCDKGLTTAHGCRAHFGTTAVANFGGFPAAGRRRTG